MNVAQLGDEVLIVFYNYNHCKSTCHTSHIALLKDSELFQSQSTTESDLLSKLLTSTQKPQSYNLRRPGQPKSGTL